MRFRQKGLLSLIDFFSRLETKLEIMRSPGVSQSVEPEQLDGQALTFVAPCFVLSTGRCGTLWLTRMLRLSRYTWVNHSDLPELIRHSRLAYEQYEQSPRIFCEIIRAARDDFIVRAYKRGQIYIETNNRITFFAYAIKQVYPNAKFIHLIRHPGDFVRSGLSRGWYQGQRHDIGRITKSNASHSWQIMSDVEKIAWLWNETNCYIEEFLSKLSIKDYTQIKAEDMFSDPSFIVNLFRFIGINDIPTKTVKGMLKRQINPQQTWTVGPYSTWPDKKKQSVRHYAGLTARYGYEL